MCELCNTTPRCAPLARRNVLKLATATAVSLAAAPYMAAAKGPPKEPPKPENVLSLDSALDRLMAGNRRYVDGVSRRHDFKHEREALSAGQNPFAAILSCADSRIAPEFCFDTARGDVFVCRIAGNFASDEMIASLEYAVSVLKTPLIMVLGHESCGAVDAAIKSLKDGTTLPGHLPSLVDAIAPAVKAVQGQNGDMLTNAIRRNVALNVDKLKGIAPILKSSADDKKISIVGGVYALKSGQVDLLT
jgi:carbonic anhydrase